MNGSMNDGVLLAEFEECQKKVLLADVDVVLGSIFGRELLDGFKTVHKFLSERSGRPLSSQTQLLSSSTNPFELLCRGTITTNTLRSSRQEDRHMYVC